MKRVFSFLYRIFYFIFLMSPLRSLVLLLIVIDFSIPSPAFAPFYQPNNTHKTLKRQALVSALHNELREYLQQIAEDPKPEDTPTRSFSLLKPSYVVINSHRDTLLQNVIDQVYEDILQTTPGTMVFKWILHCNPQWIYSYLGVSENASHNLADQCDSKSPPFEATNSPYNQVYPTSTQQMEEAQPISTSRNYKLILSQGELWDYESWTTPQNYETSLVFSGLSDKDGFTYSNFVKLIAHEFAVAFDMKFLVGSKQWNQIPDLKKILNQYGESSYSISIALNNPLISHQLTQIRAFKIEKSIIYQLFRSGVISPPSLNYFNDVSNYIFDKTTCPSSCLLSHLRTETNKLLPLSLPLLENSPSYRLLQSTQLQIKTEHGKKQNGVSKRFAEIFQYTLEKWPEEYEKVTHGFSLLESIEIRKQNKDLLHLSPQTESKFQIYFRGHFLQPDLDTIDGLLVAQKSKIESEDLLEFLTEPLLSGNNSTFATGPRPRIRTGGGF